MAKLQTKTMRVRKGRTFEVVTEDGTREDRVGGEEVDVTPDQQRSFPDVFEELNAGAEEAEAEGEVVAEPAPVPAPAPVEPSKPAETPAPAPAPVVPPAAPPAGKS